LGRVVMNKYLIYVIDPGDGWTYGDTIADMCVIEANSEEDAKEQAFMLFHQAAKPGDMVDYKAIPFDKLTHGTIVY